MTDNISDDITDPDVDFLLNSALDDEGENNEDEGSVQENDAPSSEPEKKPRGRPKGSLGQAKKSVMLEALQKEDITALSVRPSLQKQYINPLDGDNLVQITKDQASTQTILNAILNEIAEEIAYLKTKREERWNTDEKDIEVTSLKRVQALQQMVEAVTKKEKLSRDKNEGKIDFYSDNFQRVLKSYLEIVKETMKKVHIPDQYLNIFFSQLAKEFDGFEKKSEKIYYGKGKSE